MRPLTNQTLYRSDLVGTVVSADDRPLVARSLVLGEIIDGEVTSQALKERVRALCIPVRYEGRTIAVVNRESAPSVRHPGELERTYVEVFNRFARMIAAGEFPFASEEGLSEEAPRVGDGVILLDDARPGSSTRRRTRCRRCTASACTPTPRACASASSGLARERWCAPPSRWPCPTPRRSSAGPQVTVLLRCIPLVEHGRVTGAVVLLRDISELRRRDRLLVSKDATIREIHHRVKNNLQTISSLLRLQGRRLSSPEAKAAIEESVRRIRSIALVHEILSHEAGDDVPFVDIARPLGAHGRGGAAVARPPDRDQDHRRRRQPAGHGGHAAGRGAQRAAPERGRPRLPGRRRRRPATASPATCCSSWTTTAASCGCGSATTASGCPRASRSTPSTGLGVSIVRTLVTTELGGTIAFGPGRSGGAGPGTTVDLRVPLAPEAETLEP